MLVTSGPLVIVPFVLFSSYGTLFDLHSFPTRRSSDLTRRAPRAHPPGVLGRGGCQTPKRRGPARRARCGPRRAAAFGDRKSTRLNSSHRCISYAVFCFKKKNVTTETGRTPGVRPCHDS